MARRVDLFATQLVAAINTASVCKVPIADVLHELDEQYRHLALHKQPSPWRSDWVDYAGKPVPVGVADDDAP